MLAVILAIGSSLGWGVSDFLGGLKSRSVPLISVLLVSQVIALVLLAAMVLALGGGPLGGAFLLFAALAGVSETVGVAALYRGLAVGVMGIVAAVAATAPVVVLSSLHPLVTIGLARLYLHENLERLQQIGITLCLCGMVAVSAA